MPTMGNTGAQGPAAGRPEQRASRRKVVPVRCWIVDGKVERYASLADISLDGARLLTASPPLVGTTVTMRFRLHCKGNEVSAEARVVWRSEGFRGRGGVMGVEFISLTGTDEIVAYVGEG